MYNYYREKRNEYLAIVWSLCTGWFLNSVVGFDSTISVIAAMVLFVLFRGALWFSPWSERISDDSREHINSTPWQPMRDLDEIKFAPDSAYLGQELME